MHNTHWTITQPCHEPIEKMDLTGRGHFCHACEKEVIDLDGKTPKDIGYKTGDSICGRISVAAAPKASAVVLGKWPSFLLRYFGVAALFFIPLKKGQAQNQLEENKPDQAHQKNKIKMMPRRLVGTLRGEDGKPLRTQVKLTDSTGNVIDDTTSIANGRFLLQADSSRIKGDSIQIADADSTFVVTLDTNWVFSFPGDTIYIKSDILPLAGFCMPVTITVTSGYVVAVEQEKVREDVHEKEIREITDEEQVYLPVKKTPLSKEQPPIPEKPGAPEKPQAVIPPASNQIQRSNKKAGKK